MWELIVILLLMVWSIVCLVFTLVRMKKGIAKRDANMLGICELHNLQILPVFFLPNGN